MVDHGTGGRGQSQLLGIVFLFALVVTVASTVVVVGGQELTQAKDDTAMQKADATMLEFQSAVSSATDDSPGHVTFDTGGNAQAATGGGRIADEESLSVDPDAGHVTVTLYDSSDDETHTVVDRDLGTVSYSQEEQRVAYQGGGVFRKTNGADESVLVSPPEFGYSGPGGEPTLSLRLTTVETTGDGLSGETVRIEPLGSDTAYPDAGLPSLPLDGRDEVTITVQSKYYQAWGAFLAERTGMTPVYDHDDRTVELSFTNPQDSALGYGPVVSTSGGDLTVNNQVTIDSYDSRNGDYASQSHGTAPFFVYGDLTIQSDAELDDVYVTGDATLKSGAMADTAYHDGGMEMKDGAAATDGGSVPSGSMPDVGNYDAAISDRVSSLEDDNDNEDAEETIDAVEGGPWWVEDCHESDPCVLGPGDYHLERITLDQKEDLIFEPDGETIRVAVEDGIDMDPGSNITVRGDGRVKLYSTDDVTISSRANVTNEGREAPQFQLWQHTDHDVELGSESIYVGLLHAGRQGDIVIASNENGDIYGAVIGDMDDADGVAASRPFHYDRALAGVTPPGAESGPPEVEYLRVTTAEVETSDRA